MLPIHVASDVPSKGASAILLRRDAVLMVKRAGPPFQGLWSFPGGRIESGEIPESTARREVLEETGLAAGALVSLGRFEPVAGSGSLIEVFAGRAPTGEPHAGDDALCARFVPFAEVLLTDRTPGAAGWIARAVRALSRL